MHEANPHRIARRRRARRTGVPDLSDRETGEGTPAARPRRFRHRSDAARRPCQDQHAGRGGGQDRQSGGDGRAGPHLARARRRRRRLLHEGLQAPRHRRAHRGVVGDRGQEDQRRPSLQSQLPRRGLPQRGPHDGHGCPGRVLHRPVRQQHLPHRIEDLQRAARPGRHQLTRGGRTRPRPQLLRGRRRRHRRPHRQRPRRQLLRPEQHARVLVHRRVLLLRPERVLQPQRDDDRRLRLVAPHRSEPAERAGARQQLHECSGPPRPVRGRVRARVPAPAPLLRRSGGGHLDQRGHVGHGDRADRLRRPRRADHRRPLRLPHPVLPREQRRPDGREPEPEAGRSGELPERLGRPGLRPRTGDPVRLRGRLQLPPVARGHVR